MRPSRRTVLVGSLGLLAGCLDDSSEANPREKNNTDTDSNGEEKANQSQSDDVPYRDISATFGLRGTLISKEEVINGFDIISSDDKQLKEIQLYEELFDIIEKVPERDRRKGMNVATGTVVNDSKEGVKIRNTVWELRSKMDKTNHPGDRKSSIWGTHYIKHDGEILRVSLASSGDPE